MFFRREKPRTPTVDERVEGLRHAGFTVTPSSAGNLRVSRSHYTIDLKEESGTLRCAGRAGIRIGDEIGSLVDGGYQKFFQTPSGIKKPALAEHLKALHDFEEDLKEALGQESYYNESLGTVSTFYLYDRVTDRDRGVPKRAWEK
jgi:hypothetical protein